MPGRPDISGYTMPFAVLGHPIGHSLSPVMHNAAFEAMGLDAIYLAFDVHPDNLMEALDGMQSMGFKGANLTVPLKEVAFRGLSRIEDSAKVLGAVNTVEFEKEGLVGHNTDGAGFLKAIDESFGMDPKGVSVLVLGTGGAGRAVAITLALAGAGRITLTDVSVERTAKLANEIKGLSPKAVIQQVEATPAAQKAASLAADLVVQATPVGMKKDDPSLLPVDAFRAGQKLFDLVYMYPETAIMKAAKASGADVSNGLGMLLHQGAAAFTIWTGKTQPIDVMRNALAKRVYSSN